MFKMILNKKYMINNLNEYNNIENANSRWLRLIFQLKNIVKPYYPPYVHVKPGN